MQVDSGFFAAVEADMPVARHTEHHTLLLHTLPAADIHTRPGHTVDILPVRHNLAAGEDIPADSTAAEDRKVGHRAQTCSPVV